MVKSPRGEAKTVITKFLELDSNTESLTNKNMDSEVEIRQSTSKL